MASFSPVSIGTDALEQLALNPFELIGKDWMLVTAGEPDEFLPDGLHSDLIPAGTSSYSGWNTMTASWGTLGVLWNKRIANCFIRPPRYTYEFIEKSSYYTLSFFTEEYRKALNICGSISGRTHDKMSACGLHPVKLPPHVVSYAEASLVLVCRKLYSQDIDPRSFCTPEIAEHYAHNDYHRSYIGEIIGAYRNK